MNSTGPENLHDSLNIIRYKENWTGRDGRPVVLRLMTSQDKSKEKELIDGLSLQSSRYRFFHAIKDASEAMVNKFCDIDYHNEIAVIAEYDCDGQKKNVGVVRLFIDPGSQTGEFAILVADSFQGTGLGSKFMETLLDIGRERGLKTIYGTVMTDNIKMLALVKKMGFSVGPNSYGEVKIERQL